MFRVARPAEGELHRAECEHRPLCRSSQYRNMAGHCPSYSGRSRMNSSIWGLRCGLIPFHDSIPHEDGMSHPLRTARPDSASGTCRPWVEVTFSIAKRYEGVIEGYARQPYVPKDCFVSFWGTRLRTAMDSKRPPTRPKSSPRAKAGVQSIRNGLDSCLRRNDGERFDPERTPWSRRQG